MRDGFTSDNSLTWSRYAPVRPSGWLGKDSLETSYTTSNIDRLDCADAECDHRISDFSSFSLWAFVK